MLSLKKICGAALCLSLTLTALTACSGKNGNQDDSANSAESAIEVIGENSFYSSLELSEYVKLCDYKGQAFDISDTDGSRKAMEEAVKEHIFEKSEIKKYPDEPIEYYAEQEKSLYKYLAKGDAEQYEALVEEAGMSEEKFIALAKKYVAEDMIFYAITEAEGISVSDTEKAELFDKYAAEYAELYDGKYSVEYVKENMSELIYDSMLYDKTMEFLIESNEFVSEK